jgi:hypothetical protein
LTAIRDAYLLAASSAVALLREPVVALRWTEPSALADFTVGGLAAHLAAQVESVPARLAEPAPTTPPIDLAEHYSRAAWVGADLDDEANLAIRGRGEELAADGPAAVLARAEAAAAQLGALLTAAGPDRTVSPPAGPWALTLDDFLLTRTMEIAVHSDDLACSVGLDGPDLPGPVLVPVFALLTSLAVRRHGATALLRTLSRSERAPATVSAF